MDSIFDNMANSAFKTVKAVFGYAASWTPAAGGSAITASVLFTNTTDAEKLNAAEFYPGTPRMEYYEGDLAGLFDSVNQGGTEIITINGTNYNVRVVKKAVDGKTYKAEVEPA